jgi:RNA polymerase sigma-70 factor, ECF subfamily
LGFFEPSRPTGVLGDEGRGLRVDADELLVERIRGGDIAAFDVLYERHEVRLFSYLHAVLHDRGDAEEVLHDAFLKVLRDQRAEFKHDGSFRSWLYRVARNMALNHKRSTGRRDRGRTSIDDERDDGGVVVAQQTANEQTMMADRAIEARQLDAALAVALGRLPSNLGELWHLRTSGLSYEQIATVVDVPLGTVKSRMHQMVNVLREELKPWIAPE